MKFLWLAYLPLLFLPNLGAGNSTGFGTLELADFLIGPFLVLVGLAAWGERGQTDRCLAFLLAGFVGWGTVSTLLIRERYGYPTDSQAIVGLLKLGKLSLYGVTGLLAARALADETQRRRFPWSLLAAGVVVAASLFAFQDASDELRPSQVMEGYKSKNAVSVMMAMLICYLGGLWITGGGTRRWRSLAGPGLCVMILGYLLSNGRGGWVASLAGAAYLLYRRGIRARMLVALAGATLLLTTAYAAIPDFRADVDRTLWPDAEYLEWYHSGVGGFDDGARLACWTHELAAFVHSPILGTGFFHRGGGSGLWADGSHNFFLQMFLETGAVGGLLIVGALARMWCCAGSDAARAAGLDAPVRSALIAAVVGGMTGEYFYGGTVLLVLLLVYAPVGALGAPTPSETE